MKILLIAQGQSWAFTLELSSDCSLWVNLRKENRVPQRYFLSRTVGPPTGAWGRGLGEGGPSSLGPEGSTHSASGQQESHSPQPAAVPGEGRASFPAPDAPPRPAPQLRAAGGRLPRPPPAPRPRRRPDWLAQAKRPLAIGHGSPAGRWAAGDWRLASLGIKAQGAQAAQDSHPPTLPAPHDEMGGGGKSGKLASPASSPSPYFGSSWAQKFYVDYWWILPPESCSCRSRKVGEEETLQPTSKQELGCLLFVGGASVGLMFWQHHKECRWLVKNLKNPNSVTVKFRLEAPGQRPKTQQITNISDWLIDLESNLLFYFSLVSQPF